MISTHRSSFFTTGENCCSCNNGQPCKKQYEHVVIMMRQGLIHKDSKNFAGHYLGSVLFARASLADVVAWMAQKPCSLRTVYLRLSAEHQSSFWDAFSTCLRVSVDMEFFEHFINMKEEEDDDVVPATILQELTALKQWSTTSPRRAWLLACIL